jgi:hypothetical protein
MTDAVYPVIQEFSRYLPSFFGAALILVIGVLVAKVAKMVVYRMVASLQRSPLLSNTPLEMVMGESESVGKVAELVSTVVYWVLLCLVLQHVFSVLGLFGLSELFARVVGYVPRVVSAVVVLVVVLALSGFVEQMVKQMVRSWSVDVARVSGVVAGYVVMVIGVLAAVSELGIARDFIMVLFVGLVAALSLGVGLALGLGGQDMVRTVVAKLGHEWQEKTAQGSSTSGMPSESPTPPETPTVAGSSKPRKRVGR